VTSAENEIVQKRAEALGLPLSVLIRNAVLGRRDPGIPQINREAWARLGGLAANLNQYVHAINMGRAAGAPLQLLLELQRELVALRAELLGRDPED
jgi:hypothetical protein